MSNPVTGISPTEPTHGMSALTHGQHNSSSRAKGEAMPSAMRAAQVALTEELSSSEEKGFFEGLTRLRRGRLADGIDLDSSNENYLEQLLQKLTDADWANLETLLMRFPGFEQEVSLLTGSAGAEGERWRRLKEALHNKQGKLKETLMRYLKAHGGEIAISLLSFLEFGENNAQVSTMKGLYRYAADSCKTMADLFKYLIQLTDREARLRALLHAVAFELSSTETALSQERERLATIITDIRRLLILLGLNEDCVKTATQLNEQRKNRQQKKQALMLWDHPAEDEINGNEILEAFIAMSEIAWIDADWLENQLAKLVGGDLEAKLYCARLFRALWEKLPPAFFEDEGKRDQIVNAFVELNDTLVKQDEENDYSD